MDDVVSRIEKLKKEKNAVILAHNYQIPEVQDIADFSGDSLGLSIQASKTDADVIVFCGVSFMAETAKILSPQKTVLIPEKNAGCPMADMISVEQLRELKKKHPNAKVLSYVNTSAAVKTESDYCCTSANAIEVLKRVFQESEEVIFVPDKYLGGYASKQIGRKVILWEGYCPTHVRILPENIQSLKRVYPEAKVMVHPECSAGVIGLADEVVSTSGMLKFAKKSDAKEFIVGTENGMVYALKKENPDKEFYPATELGICPNMKLTTLQKVLWSLENLKDEVVLSDETIRLAQKSLQNMIN